MAEEKRPVAGTERGRGRPKQVRVRCPHCQGTGKDILKIAGKTKPTIKECPVCHGAGYLVKSEGQTNEQAPTNSMGGSSPQSGSGAVATFDTLMGNKPMKRKMKNIRRIGPGNIQQI